MKHPIKGLAVATMSFALLLSVASPASAGTKEGTASCASVARNAVRGEQQRMSMMTLKLAGSTVYSKYGEYVGWGYSASGGTKSWSASSDWLIWAGSYGTCAPKVIN